MPRRTILELDLDLVKEAMEITLSRIEDVVHHSLQELVNAHTRKRILSLQGKVKCEGNLDEYRSI